MWTRRGFFGTIATALVASKLPGPSPSLNQGDYVIEPEMVEFHLDGKKIAEAIVPHLRDLIRTHGLPS